MSPIRRGRRSPWCGAGRKLSLRTYVGMAAALPFVALVVAGAVAVDSARESWQAAGRVEELAGEIGAVVDAESAMGRELSLSYAPAVIDVFDLDVADDERARAVEDGTLLRAAREETDRLLDDLPGRDLLSIDEDLDAVRAAVDDGEPSPADLSELFATAQVPLSERSEALQSQLDRLSRTTNLPPTLEARRRALRESMLVLTSASERISALFALAANPEEVRADLVEEIIELGAVERAAGERRRRDVGPQARAALEQLDRAGTSRALDGLYEAVVTAAVQEGSLPAVDGIDVVNVLVDGVEYANDITEVAVAAAADLEDAASEHAADATRTAAAYLATGLVVSLLSAALVVGVGRAVARPAQVLEAGARHISEGEFRVAMIPPSGPRELGAAVEAFNEMTGTLTAVEEVATSMADEAHDPALPERPLPGPTGAVMQAALGRLRAAMAESARQRAELHTLATEDSLTGLLNHRAVFDELEREIARAQRQGRAVMALYVDLDGLKDLNDTYGHAAGDAAIQEAGRTLKAATRDVDTAARIGGDEFLVIGSVDPGDDGRHQADQVADRILRAISSARTRIGHAVIPLRASVGVAVVDGSGLDDGSAPERLVKAADDALYVAKREGRDRVAWADGWTAG